MRDVRDIFFGAVFDADGIPTKLFYGQKDKAPEGALEITWEQHDLFSRHPGRMRWDGQQAIGITPHDRTTSYHTALGSFLQAYAEVEAATFSTLAHYAGITDKMARALFSGTRAKAALDYIRRIVEAHEMREEILTELTLINDHLGPITDARNDLLHYGSTGGGADRQIANQRAHIPKKQNERMLSEEIFGQMTKDLNKIERHIKNLKGANSRDQLYPDMTGGHMMSRAWRYKPALPKNRQNNSPNKPRTQQRQP